MNETVVITGFGGITACGHTIEDSWRAIKAKESGVASMESWDASEWTYAKAA